MAAVKQMGRRLWAEGREKSDSVIQTLWTEVTLEVTESHGLEGAGPGSK